MTAINHIVDQQIKSSRGKTLQGVFPGFSSAVPIAPLITFRVMFGLLMFISILRFWWRGWVTTVYVLPEFHFTYMGFGWVQPLGSVGMHILFMVMALATLCIAAGFLYRTAAIVFFLAFTYVELIEVTTYLNHYYFISLIAFLLIWLPANADYSVDVFLKPSKRKVLVPAWSIGIIRFQLGVVYIFAGLAKINPDWLLAAEPMRTWLPSKTHLPIVGKYLYQTWVAYLFSWFGAAYDLLIVFFLLHKKTRPVAYFFVVVFHVATAVFFPGIGMFPFVMIVCSLVFFPASFHDRLLSLLPFYRSNKLPSPGSVYGYRRRRLIDTVIVIYCFFQLVIPLRFLLYPDNLFWNEEGYRFSWRVMLMEKSGIAYFTVKDGDHQQGFEVNNAEFLTPLQEKMMSTQPDMILKYAHFLASEYEKRGLANAQVYGEVYVSLNGARSRLFIDSTVDLAKEPLKWGHFNWVLPFNK